MHKPEENHQALLSFITDTRVMGSLVQERLANARVERCGVADMTFDAGRACTILYEVMLAGSTHFVLAHWDADEARRREARSGAETLAAQVHDGARRWRAHTAYVPELSLLLEVFPVDHRLPGLICAAQSEAIKALMHADVQVEVLRYRPSVRCTLRYCVSNGATIYGKVYHGGKGAHTYQVMAALWSARAAQAEPLIAQPLAYDTDHELLLQSAVTGRCLLDWLFADQSSAIRVIMQRVGRALAEFHRWAPPVGAPYDPHDDLARLHRHTQRVALVAPDLARQLERALDVLTSAVPAESHRSMTHGDFKPAQVFVTDHSINVIDFDHARPADPARDVANFVGSLAKYAATNPGLTARLQVCMAEFREVYCADCDSTFAQRLSWYESLALTQKAVRAFRRNPYSNTARALVSLLEQSLSEVTT